MFYLRSFPSILKAFKIEAVRKLKSRSFRTVCAVIKEWRLEFGQNRTPANFDKSNLHRSSPANIDKTTPFKATKIYCTLNKFETFICEHGKKYQGKASMVVRALFLQPWSVKKFETSAMKFTTFSIQVSVINFFPRGLYTGLGYYH